MEIKGFKGFNADMTCRGFKFEEGKTYTNAGKPVACENGFHFCENPLDVFSYYSPANSVFHEVIGGGETDKHNDDSKIACSEIKIGASVNLHDFISASISFLFNREYKNKLSKHSTGDSSASSATGYSSASSATGYSSASSATGYSSASSATGYSSASSATGDKSASSATGYSSASSATGDNSASSATGYKSASSATGYSSASSATGDASVAICTGLESKAMAGKFGVIALLWWNRDENRSEMKCAETGCGDGSDGKLKAETWYQLDKSGNFQEVT